MRGRSWSFPPSWVAANGPGRGRNATPQSGSQACRSRLRPAGPRFIPLQLQEGRRTVSDFLLVIALSIALAIGVAMALGLVAGLFAGVARGVFGHHRH